MEKYSIDTANSLVTMRIHNKTKQQDVYFNVDWYDVMNLKRKFNASDTVLSSQKFHGAWVDKDGPYPGYAKGFSITIERDKTRKYPWKITIYNYWAKPRKMTNGSICPGGEQLGGHYEYFMLTDTNMLLLIDKCELYMKSIQDRINAHYTASLMAQAIGGEMSMSIVDAVSDKDHITVFEQKGRTTYRTSHEEHAFITQSKEGAKTFSITPKVSFSEEWYWSSNESEKAESAIDYNVSDNTYAAPVTTEPANTPPVPETSIEQPAPTVPVVPEEKAAQTAASAAKAVAAKAKVRTKIVTLQFLSMPIAYGGANSHIMYATCHVNGENVKDCDQDIYFEEIPENIREASLTGGAIHAEIEFRKVDSKWTPFFAKVV